MSTTSSLKKPAFPIIDEGKVPACCRELRRGGEHQCLVAGFVIARSFRPCARLRNHHRASVDKTHDVGNVEDVLIEAGKEKRAVAPDGAAQGKAELLLLIVRLEIHEGMGCRQGAVPQEIEIRSVKTIGARLGDHIHHCASGTSQVGAVGIRGDAKLLYHFVGELIRRAIAAAGLSEKGVVVVAAVHQVAGLKAADAAKSKIAIRTGSETAWVLGHARSQQGQVGETPSVERKFVDGPFVDQCRESAGLRFRPAAARPKP